MKKNKKKGKSVSAVYSQLRKSLGAAPFAGDDAERAAAQLRAFGLTCNEFLNHKLQSASPEELGFALELVPYLQSPGVEDGLRAVVLERAVPLALKRRCFEIMAELGHPIDKVFLSQLGEAEEILLQLTHQLDSSEEKGIDRALALADDFLALPQSLKLSFLGELADQDGGRIRSLPFLRRIAGQDGQIDLLIIEMVGDAAEPAAAELLELIADESADKETVKRARRALYKLRERGVTPTHAQADRTPQSEPAVQDSGSGEQAYATTFDSFGGRLLVLALPGISDVLVCKGTVEDERGLLSFTSAQFPRKQFRDHLKELREHVESRRIGAIYQIDPDHCRWLLDSAYERNIKTGTLVPEGYKALRYRLKPPPGFEPAGALAGLVRYSEDDVRAASARMQEVFSIPEVVIWTIEKNSLGNYVRRYIEIAESKLMVNENQRRDQLEKALDDFASEYFASGRLELIVLRLRETAYLLALAGREDDARLLAALAEDVSGSSFLEPHPFLRNIIVGSIASALHVLERQEAERRAGGSVIVRPGEERARE